MKPNRMIYSILFAVWIGFYYLRVWGNLSQDMADSLAFNRQDPVLLSTFQAWMFNLINLVFDSIFIAVAVGVFSYHYRHQKAWHYIVLGLFIRYLVFLVFLPVLLYRNSLSQILDEIVEFANHEFYILGSIQLVSAIVASHVGMSIGKNAEFLDEKDEQFGYLAGCSKKLWAVLIIAFNPVFRLVTKYSIVHVYDLSVRVSSPGYWDYSFWALFGDEDNTIGITGIIISIAGLSIIWAGMLWLYFYGIQTIATKDSAYRRVKIIVIFVAIPVLVVGIPLIRNRTWFF